MSGLSRVSIAGYIKFWSTLGKDGSGFRLVPPGFGLKVQGVNSLCST